MNWLQPKDSLTQQDVDCGMRNLIFDGACSQIMVVLTSGAFLVAFALLIGASNKTIGFLAAIGPLMQILQIPSIFLVDRVRRRKLLVVLPAFLSRMFWLLIAALPWVVPEAARIPMLMVSLVLASAFANVAGCSFNSWMRDLIPESIMGRFYSKRLAIAVGIGAALSLLAGIGIDLYNKQFSSEIGAYSILFTVACAFGLLGTFFLGRIPEPRMAAPKGGSLRSILSEPFLNHNFRHLLKFLGTWNFAVNLAAPFFTVYLLKRLGLSMVWVIGLTVLSQLVNVSFLRIWGRLADRFTNKSVLTVSGPLFMVSILLWPFTTLPDAYLLTIPLLISIHVLAGMSTAGVTLCTGNIALKSAPKGSATAYLATNALVSGIAASLAPILAGFAADWFNSKELALTVRWASTAPDSAQEFILPAFNLQGLDFLFIIAVLLGFYALHRLLAVKEEGEVEEDIVVTQLYAEVRKTAKQVSTVTGLRYLTEFPYALLKDSLPERGRKRRASGTGKATREGPDNPPSESETNPTEKTP